MRCLGIYGGVRGNENVIEGRVLCDYCSCEVDGTAENHEITCPDCQRPISGHILITIGELEGVWKEGIVATICGGEGHEYPDPDQKLLVAVGGDMPDDPCDEDFMKSISS